eukprot:1066154-Rhodomonas_salina.2
MARLVLFPWSLSASRADLVGELEGCCAFETLYGVCSRTTRDFGARWPSAAVWFASAQRCCERENPKTESLQLKPRGQSGLGLRPEVLRLTTLAVLGLGQVPLEVKLNCGVSWGNLMELKAL